jgi:hypothetical protein
VFCALWKEAPNAPVPLKEDDMTTPSARAFVSVVATLTITLALGACVRAPSQTAADLRVREETAPLAIRFDNSAREYVHVYLISEEREWFLGRVEVGAIAMLRIPAESFARDSRHMRLAVLTGEPVTLQAAHNPRATITLVQPTSAIIATPWRFAQGQLTQVSLRNPRADVRRR